MKNTMLAHAIRPAMAENDYLTQDEVSRLFSVIEKPRDKAIFVISYWRGLTNSEVASLPVSAFHPDETNPDLWRLRIVRGHGSFGADCLLAPLEAEAIAGWLRVRDAASRKSTRTDSTFLFTSRNGGGRISRKQFWYMMKHYGELAGIPKFKRYFRILKQSLIVHLSEEGVDVVSIRNWVGHRQVNNTI